MEYHAGGRYVDEMTKGRKYNRMIIELEIESVDSVTAAVFRNDVLVDQQGEVLGMAEPWSPEWEVAHTVSRIVFDALSTADPSVTGVRFLSGSPIPRSLDAQGNHPPVTLPALPGRADDGLSMDMHEFIRKYYPQDPEGTQP